MFYPVQEIPDNASTQWSRVIFRSVLGEFWSSVDSVCQDIDFHVGLQDGHLDVEGSNFVGETLKKHQQRHANTKATNIAKSFESPSGSAIHPQTGSPEMARYFRFSHR